MVGSIVQRILPMGLFHVLSVLFGVLPGACAWGDHLGAGAAPVGDVPGARPAPGGSSASGTSSRPGARWRPCRGLGRAGDPRPEPAGQCASGLDVEPGGAVLAGAQVEALFSGPARQERAVDDQLRRGIQVPRHRHTCTQGPGDNGRLGQDAPRDHGLRHPGHDRKEDLGQVVP